MIIKIQKDLQKSKMLIQMAKITLERLKETDNEKYPSNALTDYYDSAHKLMEAISLSCGIKTKGEGAHQELIEYVAKEKKLPEAKRLFLHELRDYRNRISYEGFMVNKNYIASNRQKIENIIRELMEIADKCLKSQ